MAPVKARMGALITIQYSNQATEDCDLATCFPATLPAHRGEHVRGPGHRLRPRRSRGRASARRIDFKVLVWYRQSDSLGTFKYQVYDVRKGEYTAAVDAWVKNTLTRFPDYFVVVRDVDLGARRGRRNSSGWARSSGAILRSQQARPGSFSEPRCRLALGPSPRQLSLRPGPARCQESAMEIEITSIRLLHPFRFPCPIQGFHDKAFFFATFMPKKT